MYDYALLSADETEKIFRKFPKIKAQQLTKEVNELFRRYLFVKRGRKEIEVWSSCCGKHERMDRIPRTITPEMWPILYGKHNEKEACPYCGKELTVKEVGRLGKRKNLLEYHPVIFLSARRGDLFARCYWSRKDYQGDLAELPKFMDCYAFHFSIGKTDVFYQDGWDRGVIHKTVTGNYNPNQRPVHEPFWEGSWFDMHYLPYSIFGMDELAKSDFRYCQYDAFRMPQSGSEGMALHSDFIKYMTAYTIYPRQIEMLMKGGGKELVDDLVTGRRKNRAIINWNETDPRKAFGLDGAEMRAFRDSGCSIYRIEPYKYLRRRGIHTSFETLKRLEDDMYEHQIMEFVKWCIKEGKTPDQAIRYFDHFTGPRCGGMGYYGIGQAWRQLIDYRAMAETLGYDLTVETVNWPRNLEQAHNEAMTEINLRREREREEADRKARRAALASLRRRRQKYNIELDGFLIRIAETATEVREEGKALSHCVGGYAERHMADMTTILFLRDAAKPGLPLYTIEMDGNRLVQIHGYGNERLKGGRRAPDPRETMRWLLDPWLEWIAKGSKRNKKGQPVGLRTQKVQVPA